MDYVYRFPVVKGIQANRTYYIAMVPMKMLSKLFPSDEEFVPPEYRAQRRLNEARIPEISKYIIENRGNYVFSALAASIDGHFEFKRDKETDACGVLEVSMDARFLLNDGQHRKAAILDALEDDESLGEETISVVFFSDRGLERSQQLFTDLNKHAVKTSNSISELYDSRDQLAVLTRNVVSKIKFLNDYTDKEKDILGKYSSNLFTLNTFYNANKRMLGGNKVESGSEAAVKAFWESAVLNIVPWNELQSSDISKKDLREKYIVTQSVVLKALGQVGKHFYQNKGENLEKTMKCLRMINWKRNDDIWKKRAIRADGRIISNERAVRLIANTIKKYLGIQLDEDDCQFEIDFKDM